MKYGLIGEKLSHSFSKPIHESIGDYTYEIKEIKKDELDSFMKEKSFHGINVTIPYKSQVIPYLDYISEDAKKIGAVNTVVCREGRLYGYNTDFGGMRALIEKAEFDFCGAKVLILGSGGTSKTARAVCESLKAKSIITVSRGGEVNYENVLFLHGDCDYIVNTTPCGMYPNNDSIAIDPTEFKNLKGIVDVVYNPLETALVRKGKENGIKGVTGLYMLVAQAVLACEIFTGEALNVKEITDRVFSKIKKEKQNIVLIGMPGCGKSTIGKALSKISGRPFIDTDDMIKEKHGDISEIFSNYSEGYFRDRESEEVKEAAKKSGYIIATGGGAILRQENIDALKQNGVIFFLNRPIEDIIPTSDRPLSSDYTALKKRFEERYDKYISAMDYEIFVDGDVNHAVQKIMEIRK